MNTPLVVSVTDELVAELEALASKATPGPWNYDGSYVCTMRKEDGTTYVESWNPVADALLSKNVRYIATANPATILALLAERAEFRRLLLEQEKIMQSLRDSEWALIGEREELLRDAGRYWWLRAQNAKSPEECSEINDFAVVIDGPDGGAWVGSDLDAAIDAAMQSEAKQ